jgi:hypothetical protein
MFGKKLTEHHEYIREYLEDMPKIRNWQWTADFNDSAAPAPLAKGHPSKAMFTDSLATSVYADSSSGCAYAVGLCQPPSAGMSSSAAFGPYVLQL